MNGGALVDQKTVAVRGQCGTGYSAAACHFPWRAPAGSRGGGSPANAVAHRVLGKLLDPIQVLRFCALLAFTVPSDEDLAECLTFTLLIPEPGVAFGFFGGVSSSSRDGKRYLLTLVMASIVRV